MLLRTLLETVLLSLSGDSGLLLHDIERAAWTRINEHGRANPQNEQYAQRQQPYHGTIFTLEILFTKCAVLDAPSPPLLAFPASTV